MKENRISLELVIHAILLVGIFAYQILLIVLTFK